ncbi:metal-dependent hydrolase [Halocatena marina]|uniref:metal-dependent hydrolase n=1 Tax=Halocatena marina TaxID=2934937 RepID=UPI00200BDF5E|nr:metal-dependent hydrolase [Halocatena marina]
MDRHGHVGFNLLVFAPVAYYFLHTDQTTLAMIGILGLFMLEPLPDIISGIPGVQNRGTSHSILSALVVGILCSILLYILSRHLVSMVMQFIFGQSIVISDMSQQNPIDANRNAWIGFFIGSSSVIIHILGDLLTPSGIRPLLPFAPFRLSLGIVPDQGWTQFVLFIGGVLTFGWVIVSKYPVVGRALLNSLGLYLL